jgi:hypothetical protein
VIDLVLPDAPASRAANLVVWSVVAATLVGWQVAALLTRRCPPSPTWCGACVTAGPLGGRC